MHAKGRLAIIVGLLAVTAALAATGSAAAATVEVRIINAAFSPSTVNINVNDTVVFINQDSFDHDVLFENNVGSSGAPGSLHAGANWSHTFASTGTFRFRCQTHSTSFDTGMVGQVVVATPGTTPPPGRSPGFELPLALAAVGAVAFVARRLRAA